MRTSKRRIPLVAALSAVLVVPTAWAAAGQSKEAIIAEMLVLGEHLRALKPRIAIDSQTGADFASAVARYPSLSTALGRDVSKFNLYIELTIRGRGWKLLLLFFFQNLDRPSTRVLLFVKKPLS